MRAMNFAMVAAMLAVTAGQAQASHIFSTNIRINGTPVATGNLFDDPTIATTVGTPVTFSFDLFGQSDTFFVSFFDAGGSTLPTPANFSINYNGSGTQAAPVTVSFTRSFASTGTFNGYLVPDLVSSNPDYLLPGGNQLSQPQIPFTINVASNTPAVPEPTSMALAGFAGMGMAVGAWRRRRQEQQSAA